MPRERLMAANVTAGLFAGLWFVLTALQSYRSFTRCPAPAGWEIVLWGVYSVLLVMPLLAIGRLRGTGSGRLNPAITLALLAYVPMMVAMRLLESCVAAR